MAPKKQLKSVPGGVEDSTLQAGIAELITPDASVLAFTQGFDREDEHSAYLNDNVCRWSPDVRAAGGVLYRAYHYEVGRVNFTMQRIALGESSKFTDAMRKSLILQACESPASTDFLEKLSWELEANRIALVFYITSLHRSLGYTVMIFLAFKSSVYAYTEMLLSDGKNVVIMTGSPSEDKQQVASILGRLYPEMTAAQIQQRVAEHTVVTRDQLKVRARLAARTSAMRQEGELPLVMILTKAASVGLDIVEANSAIMVASCDAGRQKSQQTVGRCGRSVGELWNGTQLLRSRDENKAGIVTLLYCPRPDYVVHDANHTESHLESFFHHKIWKSLSTTFGYCKCGHERQNCDQCASVCRNCDTGAPIVASMPTRRLCRTCLGEDYREPDPNVVYFPTRIMEDAEGDFATRVASPTFAPGEELTTLEDVKRRLAFESQELRRGSGSKFYDRVKRDSGAHFDILRSKNSQAACEAWIARMEASYARIVIQKRHTMME
jgi:hypothetical protein